MSVQPTPYILLGNPEGDHISVRVQGRLHPGTTDYWDANWLMTPIDVVVGGFRGDIPATLRADELMRFKVGAEGLYQTLGGEARLESMEDWISLTLAATKTGHLRIAGTICDRAGDGNRLTFRMDGIDQSYLPPVISQLNALEQLFPVIGTP